MKDNTILFIWTIVVAASCAAPGGHAPIDNHDEAAHPHHGEARGDRDHDPDEDPSSTESTDLKMTMAERFGKACEHGTKAFECDECRYEVGVVKAPKQLFDRGLIQTAIAEKRPASRPLLLTGEIVFDERRVAHVSTQADGVIQKVHVTLGDSVEKGDPLITVVSVTVGDAQAELLEAEAAVTLAKRNADRMKALRGEGISAEKEVVQAAQALEAAKIRAEAARGKLKRLGTQSRARAASGRLVLRAPVDGVVLDIHAVPGEIAHSEAPLATVGDNGMLWVWADLYEKDYAAVVAAKTDHPLDAEIRVKAFPNRRFPGVVDFVSPAMDTVSRTIKVRIAVPNPNRVLLAGMFADVDIFIPGNADVLAVPKAAVMTDEGHRFVFVHHKDDYYVRLPVEVGLEFGPWAEIIRGLDAHQAVVADGAFLMKSDVLRAKMGAGCAD